MRADRRDQLGRRLAYLQLLMAGHAAAARWGKADQARALIHVLHDQAAGEAFRPKRRVPHLVSVTIDGRDVLAELCGPMGRVL